jgi:hypothetical protein
MNEPLDSSELPDRRSDRITIREALRYTTLVWITSVLLSPVLIVAMTTLADGDFSFAGFFMVVLLIALYGGVLSIPNWLLFFGGVAFLTRQYTKPSHIRWGAQVLAFLLTMGLFFILFGLDDPTFFADDGLLFPASYLLTLSAGIWYFPLIRK